MNILFFTRLFYPHIGGVEKHVLNISRELIKQGHKITIITESLPDDSTKQHEIYQDITIYRMPYWPEGRNKKLNTWKWIFYHQNHIKNADLIHIHDVFYWYLPFRILYPRKPVYTTFHGYESYPLAKNAKLQHKIAEKLSWGNICIGNFITKWYGTEPTYISYGAADLPRKNVEPKEKNSAVFIGRLDEQTRITDFAKAIELVRKRVKKFQFTIVGDGSLRHTLSLYANFEGFQKNPEPFFDSNRFVFVSGYLSILEAMAYKRLVFALYDNPLKEDYLRLTPFSQNIIIENTPEDLSKKILYYLEHPKEEKELIEENYKWVKKQTWKYLTQIYLTLWQRKINKNL